MLLSNVIKYNSKNKLNESFSSSFLRNLNNNWKKANVVFTPLQAYFAFATYDDELSNRKQSDIYNVFLDDNLSLAYYTNNNYKRFKTIITFSQLIGISFLVKVLDRCKLNKNFDINVKEANEILDEIYNDLFSINKKYDFFTIFKLLSYNYDLGNVQNKNKSSKENSGNKVGKLFYNLNWNSIFDNNKQFDTVKYKLDKITDDKIKRIKFDKLQDDISEISDNQYYTKFEENYDKNPIQSEDKFKPKNIDDETLVLVTRTYEDEKELPFELVSLYKNWKVDLYERDLVNKSQVYLPMLKLELLKDDENNYSKTYHKFYFDESKFNSSQSIFSQLFSINDLDTMREDTTWGKQWVGKFNLDTEPDFLYYCGLLVQYVKDEINILPILLYWQMCDSDKSIIKFFVSKYNDFKDDSVYTVEEKTKMLKKSYENICKKAWDYIDEFYNSVIDFDNFVNNEEFNPNSDKRYFMPYGVIFLLFQLLFTDKTIESVEIDEPLYCLKFYLENYTITTNQYKLYIFRTIFNNLIKNLSIDATKRDYYDELKTYYIDFNNDVQDYSSRIKNENYYKNLYKDLILCQHSLKTIGKADVAQIKKLNLKQIDIDDKTQKQLFYGVYNKAYSLIKLYEEKFTNAASKSFNDVKKIIAKQITSLKLDELQNEENEINYRIQNKFIKYIGDIQFILKCISSTLKLFQSKPLADITYNEFKEEMYKFANQYAQDYDAVNLPQGAVWTRAKVPFLEKYPDYIAIVKDLGIMLFSLAYNANLSDSKPFEDEWNNEYLNYRYEEFLTNYPDLLKWCSDVFEFISKDLDKPWGIDFCYSPNNSKDMKERLNRKN